MNRPRRHRATFARAIAAAILVLATAPAFAQPAPGDYTDDTTLPAGRRGERIRQVLDAVNSGERARIEALVKDAFGGPFREIPLDDHLGALGGLYDGSRGLDFYGVRRYVDGGPPGRVVVIARNRLTQGWQGLSLTFDGTPEERITGMQIQPARPPKGTPPLPALTADAGEGRARSLPRPSGRGRGLLRHRPAGEGRPGGLRGGARRRRPQPRRPRCASTASSTWARWTRCSRRS